MTTDKIRVIVASTESLFTNVQLTADKKNDTWAKIYEMKDNLESEFKKHEQDIVKELSSEKLSEKNFVKLSPEYEKKLKLTSEKAKNLLNRYKDDPNISKKFAEISNICTSQISQINKLMKIGSITEWEKHTRENTSSINVDDYIKSDGNVSRAKISMDIQFDKINLGDIKKIASDPRIQKQFIGTEYKDKKPKSDWNEKHLKSVSYASDTEVFNLDYMLYLYEVAQYVNKKKK